VGAGQDNRQNEKVNRQDRNEDVIEWVALHVLPHEAAVRRWLRGALRNPDDMDDIIQEAYCRIAELDTLQHIRNGRAYFSRPHARSCCSACAVKGWSRSRPWPRSTCSV
jgi:DNA-directed RNA polymerase specialized sigma24 family protein